MDIRSVVLLCLCLAFLAFVEGQKIKPTLAMVNRLKGVIRREVFKNKELLPMAVRLGENVLNSKSQPIAYFHPFFV